MKYSSQVTSKREEPPNPLITEVDNYTHVRSQRSHDNVTRVMMIKMINTELPMSLQ